MIIFVDGLLGERRVVPVEFGGWVWRGVMGEGFAPWLLCVHVYDDI